MRSPLILSNSTYRAMLSHKFGRIVEVVPRGKHNAAMWVEVTESRHVTPPPVQACASGPEGVRMWRNWWGMERMVKQNEKKTPLPQRLSRGTTPPLRRVVLHVPHPAPSSTSAGPGSIPQPVP